MQILQSNLFKNSYKKLHKNQIKIVDSQIKLVMNQPDIGVLKKGDLAGVRVHKFKIDNQLYLLAYEYQDTVNLLMLLALGSHENFYDKIKNYLS